jgi:putative OPT family oligopeptide transporter
VPLRRVLLKDTSLRFPEGTAIGQLLKLSQKGPGQSKELVQGSLLGGLISLCQSGFQCIGQQLSLWFHGYNGLIYGYALGFEPALLAAGYIVGVEVACSMCIGLLIHWISIPLLSYGNESLMIDAASQASAIWRLQLRPVGIGVMLVGGVVTIIRLLRPIIAGFHSSLTSLKTLQQQGYAALSPQERDLPIQYTAIGILLTLVPIGLLLHHFLNTSPFGLTGSLQWTILSLGLLLIVISGFFFAALGGYFAGLLGG